MSIRSWGARVVVAAALLAAGVSADQLTISGTVKDSAGAAVAGAIVRSGGGAAGGVRDTTDATGAYTLVIAANTAATVTVIVQGTGTGGGFAMGTATVASPADGTPDVATVNLVVGSTVIVPTGDSLIITGTVKDSSGAAVVGATVRRSGIGGGGATVTTDATGAYTLRLVNTATTVTITATMGAGATARTGTGTATVAAPTDGTKDAATVNIVIANAVTPPAPGDTVVISGTVKDSTGAAVPNIVVTAAFGGIGGFGNARDTTDASGNYSITIVNTNRSGTITVTSRVNNVTGSVTMSIAAPADGATDRLTANIVIGYRLNPVLKTPAVMPLRGTPSVVGVYLLNGRQIDRAIMTNARLSGPRAAVIRYQDKARVKLFLDK